MSELVENVPFSFKHQTDTYRKTKLDDNCWMKLLMSGTPGAALLAFVDSDEKVINIPDSFVLRDITFGENNPIRIKPLAPNLFVLPLDRNFLFTCNEKTGKLTLQWAMVGDFVWE